MSNKHTSSLIWPHPSTGVEGKSYKQENAGGHPSVFGIWRAQIQASAGPRWGLDHKEGWVPKNWCFWTVVLKTLENPLDCKEIKPAIPKGNQSWIFSGGTDAEAPILWPSDAKNWLIGKDPDAGRDWGQEEKGMTEDEIAGWHYRLDGHEFE